MDNIERNEITDPELRRIYLKGYDEGWEECKIFYEIPPFNREDETCQENHKKQ